MSLLKPCTDHFLLSTSVRNQMILVNNMMHMRSLASLLKIDQSAQDQATIIRKIENGSDVCGIST